MKKLIAVLLGLACVMSAQVITTTPGKVNILNSTGSTLNSVCTAGANVAATTVTYPATLTSLVIATNVATVTTASAHGLWIGARVVPSGTTSVGLDGLKFTVATVPSSTTYTFATSGVADHTYTTGTSITTNSPLLSSPVWSINVLVWSGTTLLNVHAAGNSESQTSTAICSNASTY